MAKIKNVRKSSNIYIKVRASFKETFDIGCLERIKENRNIHKLYCVEGKISKKKFEYKDTNRMVSLLDYLKRTINQFEFFMMIEQFIILYKESVHYNFNINDVVLDLKNIYINPEVMGIRFVYIPIKNKDSSADLLKAIINITEISCSSITESAKNCIQNFYYFLLGLRGFDAEKIENYIMHEATEVIERLKGRWRYEYERTKAENIEYGTDLDVNPVIKGTDVETVFDGTELDIENELTALKYTSSGTLISEDNSFGI